MDIQVEIVGDVAVVGLPKGRLAGRTAHDFKRNIVPVLEKNAKVALDATRVEYMDSSGFGAILVCRHWLKDKGGNLKMFGVSPEVRQLFELIRLDDVIDICRDREEALLALNSDQA